MFSPHLLVILSPQAKNLMLLRKPITRQLPQDGGLSLQAKKFVLWTTDAIRSRLRRRRSQKQRLG